MPKGCARPPRQSQPFTRHNDRTREEEAIEMHVHPTTPDQQRPHNVTKTGHRSPGGRPGNTSGARLCAPVPGRRTRPPSGGYHRAGLPGTKSLKELKDDLAGRLSTVAPSRFARLVVNVLLSARIRLAVAAA